MCYVCCPHHPQKQQQLQCFDFAIFTIRVWLTTRWLTVTAFRRSQQTLMVGRTSLATDANTHSYAADSEEEIRVPLTAGIEHRLASGALSQMWNLLGTNLLLNNEKTIHAHTLTHCRLPPTPVLILRHHYCRHRPN